MGVYYYPSTTGILEVLIRAFSIVGGIFMIFKVLDNYITLLFCKEHRYTEVNSGSSIEMA